MKQKSFLIAGIFTRLSHNNIIQSRGKRRIISAFSTKRLWNKFFTEIGVIQLITSINLCLLISTLIFLASWEPFKQEKVSVNEKDLEILGFFPLRFHLNWDFSNSSTLESTKFSCSLLKRLNWIPQVFPLFKQDVQTTVDKKGILNHQPQTSMRNLSFYFFFYDVKICFWNIFVFAESLKGSNLVVESLILYLQKG